MKTKNIENTVTFSELNWDTEYFGVKSAKVLLHKPLNLKQWNELKIRFKDYHFISIVNQNSEPVNSQFIGKDTSAFLADVNIQFEKKIESNYDLPKNNITIHPVLERNEQVIELADFKFSKFTEDPELERRGGKHVYHQWLINSFKKPDKFFALDKDENGKVNGFLLHSYSDKACVIELIAVSQYVTNGGIGTKLFKEVEYVAFQHGCTDIRVGTQSRNLGGINFYHKVGCKQIGCHQVYHLWNV